MKWNDVIVYLAFWFLVFDIRKLMHVIQAGRDQAKLPTGEITGQIAANILIASYFLAVGNVHVFFLSLGSILALIAARLLIWRRKRKILRAWR